MGQKCEEIILEILELIFVANAKRFLGKIPILEEIDVKLQILKTLVRICFDVKALDQKKYLALQTALQEIGKMLGGWMKSIKNPAK